MSTDRDVTPIVRSWLKEDAHEDPQRILDSVRDQLDANRQSRARWLARRFPEMNNALRISIATAAVVVVALLGIRLTSPGTSGGAVATPTPTVSPSPTVTPSPTVAPSPTATPVAVRPLPEFGAGELEPGRYSIAVPDSAVTAALTIGDGWTGDGWYIIKARSPFPPTHVSFWTVENVYEDPCDAGSLPDPAVGPTVDDLVGALDAQANTDMSPAVDTEVGGFAGKVVVVTIAEVNDGCFTEPPAEGLEGKLYFVIPNGLPPSGPPARAPGRQLLPGSRDTLWIIDVDGHRVVIATSQTDPSDSDAIAAVIDSIEFAVR